MRRGSTPTHIFSVDMDLRDATIYVTYSQRGKVVVEKATKELEVTEDTITVRLTQKDTLAFRSNSDVEVQIRYVLQSGIADASDIMTIDVERILKEGVI